MKSDFILDSKGNIKLCFLELGGRDENKQGKLVIKQLIKKNELKTLEEIVLPESMAEENNDKIQRLLFKVRYFEELDSYVVKLSNLILIDKDRRIRELRSEPFMTDEVETFSWEVYLHNRNIYVFFDI